MTADIESGLNFLMGIGATVAALVFVRYWRRARWRRRMAGADAAAREEAHRLIHMTGAILLGMTAGSVLALILTPYYFALAVGADEWVRWLRPIVVPIANGAKGVAGVAALLHIAGALSEWFGRYWPLAIAVIAAAAFGVGALAPRILEYYFLIGR